MDGDFLGAASTFLYTSKHFTWLPNTVTEAQLWMALSYLALGWDYEAENALHPVKEKSLTNGYLKNLYNLAWADYYVHTRQWEKAVEPLNQSLKNFVTVATREQMRFLDAVVGRFIDRMDEMLGGQIKRLSHAMEEAATVQESALRSVRSGLSDSAEMLESIREVTRIANDMVRANAKYIDDLRQNQQQTDEAFSRVASSVEQMDLISRQQANYLKSVSAMQAEVARSIDQMNTSLNNFTKRVAEDSANASTGMLKAAAELRATGETMRDIHKDCTDAITAELKMTLDSYQDYVNQFTQRVDYLASNISDSLSHMPQAVSDTSNQFLDQVDRLSDTLMQAQRVLNETVARLYGDQRSRH